MDFARRHILEILEILLWSLTLLSSCSWAWPNRIQELGNSLYIPQSSPPGRVPSFAGPIENITVNVGREAVLECPVNHLGKYRVGWLKAIDQTILALHHRVITHNIRIDVDHEENRIWKLRIRQVQETDRGCYMCQINTEEMKKQVGCIDVLIPPDIDDRQTSSDVIVNEGDEATLVCKANGHPRPQIEWSREDKANFSVYDPMYNHSRRIMVSRHRGEVLRLKRVVRQQMGAYLCIASNDVPPAVSKRIILNVNFAPEITVPSQLYGVGPGSDVTLSCNVQAYPSAINYWLKNDKEMLLNGPKYNITELKKNSYELTMYLTIKHWEVSDESHFSCISTNSMGKADGKIQSYTYIANTEPEVKRNPVPTPEYDYFDTTRVKDTYYAKEAGEMDKSSYQTNNKNKKKNYGTGSDGETDQRRRPDRQKSSSFGSSYFVNSSNVISCCLTAKTLFLLLLLQSGLSLYRTTNYSIL